MPPRPCIHSLPMCLRDSTSLSSSISDARWILSSAQASPFSTTSRNAYPMPAKKKMSLSGPPKKGEKALRIKKKGAPVREARPPAPGERKALRKRIILSNTNALDVPGLRDLNKENMVDEKAVGQVLGVPGETVDSLRAVEAFKVGQGWGFFRRPACLVRKETVALGRLMKEIDEASVEGQTVRRVIYGERGTGKSVLLLQAMAMAFLRQWVVINFPEGRDLTNGHTKYSPVSRSDPLQYTQPDYTANLLSQIVKANRLILSKLHISQKHDLPFPVQANISLDHLAEIGAQAPDRAWPVFQALWNELTVPNKGATVRPPVLLCIDNVSHVMTNSHYNTIQEDRKLKPIHAHDFVLVKHFMDHLSGAKTLPNGGIILAATSLSEHAKSDALDVGIAMAEARQAHNILPSPSSTEGPEGAKSADYQIRLEQFWNPYKKIDTRSLEALQRIDVTRLKGISKEEARAIMEYWATSGMVRGKVEDGYVGEKWTLSGNGVLGELEKAVVRRGKI